MIITREEIYRDRRDYLLARGLCVKCGKDVPFEKSTLCYTCYNKRKIYAKKYRENNKEKISKYHKERYKTLKSKNKCPRCMITHYSKLYVFCKKCREIRAIEENIKRKKLKKT